VRQARHEIRRFSAHWLAGQEETDFRIAVGEALANVAEHERSSTIFVSCFVQGDRLTAEIVTDGVGFLPPMAIERPPRGAIRGYGLFVMHTLLDSVAFFDEGRGVKLVKSIRPKPRESGEEPF
jgi:anti-sigma regulatory factor (Ser/Thr protein kinase)